MVPFDSMMAFVRAPLVVRVAVGAATSAFAATHDAVVPLLEEHTQFHGPVPTTPLAVPTEQRLLAGALLTVVPFAEPQAPLTWVVAVFDATHDAVVPLLEVHTQFHGPVPTTPLAVPAEQRLLEGALLTVVPFAEPQEPLTCWVVAAIVTDLVASCVVPVMSFAV